MVHWQSTDGQLLSVDCPGTVSGPLASTNQLKCSKPSVDGQWTAKVLSTASGLSTTKLSFPKFIPEQSWLCGKRTLVWSNAHEATYTFIVLWLGIANIACKLRNHYKFRSRWGMLTASLKIPASFIRRDTNLKIQRWYQPRLSWGEIIHHFAMTYWHYQITLSPWISHNHQASNVRIDHLILQFSSLILTL